ncbi:MAG: hypothetical protein GC159_11225 [Phycisphaera sp.]|nr:hypothetical protein [Phycisphaera sp.]
MDQSNREQLHEWIAALIDGRLADDEQAALGELLERDAGARRVYVEYFDIHADLSLEAEQVEAFRWSVDAPVRGGAGRSRSTIARIGTWGAIAALLAVVAGMWVKIVQQNRAVDRPAMVGELSKADDAHWADGPARPRPDGTVAAGALRLDAGVATVTMISGAKLKLIGPAEVEVIDPKAVRLRRGNVTVDVPERAIGFRVVTPTADVVDLGTEFGVSVEDDGATEVHVFRGVVAARSLDSASVVPIVGHEAGRVDVTRGEFMSISFDGSRFGRPDRATPDASVAAGTLAASADRPAAPSRIKPGARVLFLGDRMTSRETHLLLINQALRGLPDAEAPRLYNAAIAFRLWFDDTDFAKYVTRYKPDYAVLEFGADIARAGEPRPIEEFDAAIVRLCDRLVAAGVEPILTTSYPLEIDSAERQPLLDQYNAVFRRLAKERGYRLADIDAVFRANGGTGRGNVQNKVDLPTFPGYQLIAESLLKTLGYADVTVPQSLDLNLLPGVVTDWAVTLTPEDTPLTSDAVASLTVDDTWKHITLPVIDKFNQRLADPTHSWNYQDQLRGYATHLPYKRGMNTVAVSAIDSPAERDAVINTGSSITAVWLNGHRIYERSEWKGEYLGSDRTPVHLHAGANTIVVEAQHSFFLSVTDTVDWSLPR